MMASSQAAQRLFLFLEAAPDAILEVDRKGRIVLANPEAERMFQRSQTELLGLSVEELVPQRVRGGHAAHRDRYAAHPVRRPMGRGLHLLGLRKDGSEFAVDINLSPLADAEGHVLCVVRDVSERRAAEEEIAMRTREVERANRLKSEFLASMSHELRTPLNTILGFSELLSEEGAGTLNEKQKRFVTHIQRDALHLLELINDILDLSKIEAGRLELHMEPFPMAVATAEVLTSIRPLAIAKNLALDGDIDTTLILQADRLRHKLIQDIAALMKTVDIFVTTETDDPTLFITNLTGQPCVVVPNGGATSLSFIGKLYDEATVLAFAKAYQDSTSFHTNRPPGFVQ